MAGYALGREALNQIRRLIREEQAKYRNPEPTRARWHAGTSSCPYVWEFDIFPGSAMPTSGTAIFNVTIDADSQDVTVTYNMTAAQMSTELLSEFSGLSAADIECTGGPLPTIPIDVEWKTRSLLPDWSPTVGASTLNNAAVCKIRQRNPR